MTKAIQTKINEQKLDDAKTFLTRVYRATHEGYTTIGLSDLSAKFSLDRTFTSRAMVNLKILDVQGKLRSTKYLWTSSDMPNLKMAGDLIREITRLSINYQNKVNEDKKAKQLIADRLIEKSKEKRNQVVVQPKTTRSSIYDKYIDVCTAFINKYKKTPFEISMSQALIDYSLPPYFGAVLNQNAFIENKKIVSSVTVDNFLYLATKYNSNLATKRTLKTTVNTDEPKTEFEKVIENTSSIVTGVSIQSLINRRNELYDTINSATTEIEKVEKVITAYEVIEQYTKKI